MKTLKYLQRFFMLLCVSFALCAVQACGDDEENEPIQEPNEEEVVKPDDGQEEDEPNQEPDEEEEPSNKQTINGHEYVDLGLSVKWATCNVGASKPEDNGDYFAWGETTTKSDYDWSTYKWCKGAHNTMTKYCTHSSYGTVDNRTTLTSSDDVATVKWGGSWRMPTLDEIKELVDKCSWMWITQNGVNGQLVTGPNGNSIFLPATGSRYGTDLYDRGSYGYYWSATLSATLHEDDSLRAYYLYFLDEVSGWYGHWYRLNGLTVRPVTDGLLSDSEK